jgi:hypothetical protein
MVYSVKYVTEAILLKGIDTAIYHMVIYILLANRGIGDLTAFRRDGKTGSKDTIKPCNDPDPPKDEALIQATV